MKGTAQRPKRRTLRTGVIGALTVWFAIGAALGPGSAGAIESSNSVVDRHGRTIEAVSAETNIHFVPPLDGNPLTREWFHSGRYCYRITGPDVDGWDGGIAIGYQVGYPATLTGRIKFSWSTPGLDVEVFPDVAVGLTDVIPKLGMELEVGFGPGIQEAELASGSISGAGGCVQVSGGHGSVTGVVGPTTIRPYVAVTGPSGDTAIAYGRLITN
ncbi:porin [Nocardia cyriacigeorgica]|uniref:Porin n=1 Tax=Nocardia cyriacigeorgica TaxID=135487 RepID=A0A5R8PAE8_9NOCA|nr:MspA family porin [Nocardia cyriacigeorgica]TLG05313.1 porin [Nocardia cyriacigeorgica]